MAKTIKIMNGYRVTVDNDVEEFREHNWYDVMDYLMTLVREWGYSV